MDDLSKNIQLNFPYQLDRIKEGVLLQESVLREVSILYADAIESGGLIHVYANGHSRIAVEEMAVRMGALTGFHPILAAGLTSFSDVIGPNGLRTNQFFEKIEGIGAHLLREIDFGKNDVMVIVTATGTTVAAVDVAIEFNRQYPDLALVAIACAEQSKQAPPKHSSGNNLWHVIQVAKKGYFLNNCMPVGDLSKVVSGQMDDYEINPLSSIGAITVVQSLNELTIKELDARGIKHHVLQNMHLNDTHINYENWLRDQRKRYARSIYNPQRVIPVCER